jgi:predicted ester cyclase
LAHPSLVSEAVAAFFAPEGVYDDRGAAQLARGREAIRDHVRAVLAAFPDLRFELTRVAHGADFTLAEWTCRMTHGGELSGLAPTGRSLESMGVDVATLDTDGAVAHLVSYYDGAAIMRGLGVLPERGSRAERLLTRAASIVRRLRRS